MSHLKDKVALITGAGQGVGQGIALALAAEGAKIAVTGRTLGKLEATCNLIEERGGSSIALEANVKSADDLARIVDETASKLGGLDVLVNNAQEVPLGPLDKVTDEAFTAGFESGPLAALRLMKLARPHMVKAGGGVIFNLVSSAGIRWDMAGYGAYGSVKQAMRPLTRAAASEWGGDNIRVLSIAPHAESPGMKYWIENNPDEAKEFFKSIPLGRVGKCEEDIGRAVASLCAPNMAYLTGATIPLDGGQANFD
ncbi:MAG: SDR family oxidoreductase [Parasphingorhabdus sp.]|uniref:SDR family NAD(P)-dependent oxidoreductase n=1 Tax=Parasphingorhabdus sp. TaxID=2709688 RepID=UPI003265149C